jgi:hypothetical protein
MRRRFTLWVAAAMIGLGLLGWGLRPTPTAAQAPAGAPPAGMPRYTVVETEGVNLLVVDNAKNVLYFYTCEAGKEAGEPLKLRGSIDLSQVGQPTITPRAEAKADR